MVESFCWGGLTQDEMFEKGCLLFLLWRDWFVFHVKERPAYKAESNMADVCFITG